MGGGKALISYVTIESKRNNGYASIGLTLLRDRLFQEGFCILEAIDISGEYSKRALENAGFFATSKDSLDNFVSLNPNAEEIISEQMLRSFKDSRQARYIELLYKEVLRLRFRKTQAYLEMHQRLLSCKESLELIDDNSQYKQTIEGEIRHLERALRLYGNDMAESNKKAAKID